MRAKILTVRFQSLEAFVRESSDLLKKVLDVYIDNLRYASC